MSITPIFKASEAPTTNQRCYIAVAGNIGVGKSTLVDFLCRRYELDPYFEPNDANPYLADFYADMPRYAFHSQMYFLGMKHKLHLQIDHCERPVLQDRTIWEDAEIFAENLYQTGVMDKRDYATYRTLYESLCAPLRAPDLLIYLTCDTKTMRRRIRQRGREMEKNIPIDYLKRLGKLYDNWIERYDLSPIITFHTNKLDYMSDLVHCHELMTTIDQFIAGRRPTWEIRRWA
jgi:deoxyadenosine/deoxycytidine kinase